MHFFINISWRIFYNEDGKLINKIQIIPKRKNDRVFYGSIYIVEDDWALYGAEHVTGAQLNIPVVDVLKLNKTTITQKKWCLGLNPSKYRFWS